MTIDDLSDEWVTSGDVLRVLKLRQVRTLRRLIDEEGLPAVRLGGNRFRFSTESLRAWLRAREMGQGK